jgi:(E)-4-hydroxy-3-methylbut-2-enyl-diphosphate synthase
LTEPPEAEAPVAAALVNRYQNRLPHDPIKPISSEPIDPFAYHRRNSVAVGGFGGGQVPRVIADFSKLETANHPVTDKELRSIGHFYLPEPDKWRMNDLGADYIYSGSVAIPFMLPNGLREILDAAAWEQKGKQANQYPLYRAKDINQLISFHPELNFLRLEDTDTTEEIRDILNSGVNWVIILSTQNKHAMAALRRFFFWLIENNIDVPVVVEREYQALSPDQLQLFASTDVGGLLIDGLGDGVMLNAISEGGREEQLAEINSLNNLAFGILQAARTRMTKTEYISCPSCGRTLFDLPETTAMIRKRTDHLKGVKIGIMGCIVNGPGEMADADYGYVGSGKGKITLYRGQDVVKRNVPSERAVDELIEIIREDGIWQEPATIE